MQFAGISNHELLAGLEGIVRHERRLVAATLANLAEVEARRLHLELAFSSMHDFCMRKLGFSEDQATRRIAAARDVRRYPQLLDAVAAGRLHLSGIERIRSHLTDDNIDDWIAAASGKSRRELDELIARRAPKPDVPDAVRLIPQQGTLEAAPAAQPENEQHRPRVMPIAEDRYAFSFTASRALVDKLEKVRSLTRHRNPKGDLAIIFEAGLDLQLTKLEKQKKANTTRPRRAKASKDPGYVSAETRRLIHERDRDQCAYVSPNGERCPARELLELDHEHPRALGGTGDASNIRLLCRPHNLYAAEQAFGREHIKQKIAASRLHAESKVADAVLADHAGEPAGLAHAATAARNPVSNRAPDSQRSERDADRDASVAENDGARPVSAAAVAPDPRRRGSSGSPMHEVESVPTGRSGLEQREGGSPPCSHGGAAAAPDEREGGASPTSDGGANAGGRSFVADTRPPREIVYGALTGLGFRAKDTQRVLDALPAAAWSQSLESIVRTALLRLT